MLSRTYVRKHISLEAALGQMAEEASEVAKAALKLARAEGNGNPTPVSPKDARDNLIEELVDLMMCVQLLFPDEAVKLNGLASSSPKWDRWVKRIKDAS